MADPFPAGIKELVVERDPSLTRSSTALSMVSIRSQFTRAVNAAISRVSIGFIRDFRAMLGVYVGIGSLSFKENRYQFLARSPEGAAQLSRFAEMQRGLGAATELWSPEQISARFPWLNTYDLTAATFGPRDEGWFDNLGLLGRFPRRSQGASFVKDEVTGIEVTAGRVTGGIWGRALWCLVALRSTQAHRLCDRRPPARHARVGRYRLYMRPEQSHWITATVPDRDGPCDATDFEPDMNLFEDVIWEQLYHRAPVFDAVKVARNWVGHYAYNTLDQSPLLVPHPDVPKL